MALGVVGNSLPRLVRAFRGLNHLLSGGVDANGGTAVTAGKSGAVGGIRTGEFIPTGPVVRGSAIKFEAAKLRGVNPDGLGPIAEPSDGATTGKAAPAANLA